MAGVLFFYDWNFIEAENLFKRALELDQKNATVHQQYAEFLSRTGRTDEAGAQIAQAKELEPHSAFISAFYAGSLGDNDKALEEIRSAIHSDPNHYLPHLVAASIYRQKKMFEELITELRRVKELSPQQTLSEIGLIGALKRTGRIDEARAIADRMFSESTARYIPPTHLALVSKHFEDKDRAFAYLEEAYKVRDPKLLFLNETRWDDYRDDPRFQDLVRRIGLPP